MPTRLHRPIHEKSTTLDRALAHPHELTIVGLAWAVFGGMLCYTWMIPGVGPSTVLGTLNPLVASLLSVMLLTGGLCIILAVLWPGKDSTAWGFEFVGLPLGAGAWFVYGTAALLDGGIWWPVLAACYTAGAALRFVAAVLARRKPTSLVLVTTNDDAA